MSTDGEGVVQSLPRVTSQGTITPQTSLTWYHFTTDLCILKIKFNVSPVLLVHLLISSLVCTIKKNQKQ